MHKLFLFLFIGIYIPFHLAAQNTWLKSSTTTSGTLYSPVISGNKYGLLVAGTIHNGIYISTNNGLNWSYIGQQYVDINRIAISDDGVIYAGLSSTSSFYISKDTGNTWTQFYNWTVNDLKTESNGIVYMAASGFVRKSTDHGDNWSIIYNPYNSGSPNPRGINVIAFTPQGYIVGGGCNGNMLISKDSGVTWSLINTGIPVTCIRALRASTTGVIYAGTDAGVFYTTDEGNSWHSMNGNIPNRYINCLEIINNNVYAGTSNGVYVSYGTDSSWTDFNSGLNITGYTNINSMHYSANNYFLCGITNQPVYRIDQLVTSVWVNDSKSNSFSIFPNPAASATILSFEQKRRESVRVRILNAMGMEVKFFESIIESGQQQLILPVQELQDGFYYCIIETGTTVEKLRFVKTN